MFEKQRQEQGQQDQNQGGGGRDLFADVGDSDPSSDGVYPEPGVYPVLEVQALKIVQSRKGDDIWIAELAILQSLVDLRPSGTEMTWAANFRHDATPGNVKSFLAAVMNVPTSDVDAAGVRFSCSDDNPCAGRLFRMEAVNIVTKAGNDFTRCTFRPLPDETQDQRAAFRDAVGLENVPF